MTPGRFLSAKQVRESFLPCRSTRWIKDKAREGAFGDVCLDGGGWMISEAGVIRYLERARVKVANKKRADDTQAAHVE